MNDRAKAALRTTAAALVAAGTFALLAGAVVWFTVIPIPRGLEDGAMERTALMEQRAEEAEARGESLTIRHEWVPLERISSNLERAVIVAEDYRFREHGGIDWISLAEEVRWSGDDDFSWWSRSDLAALTEALGYVWSNRDEIRGRSTITQQLVKNLYFGTERTILRKAMEAVVARRLEDRLPKDRILELYLNIAEWGPGIFGAEAASQSYFGVPASDLTLDRAAALAATLPHPLTSNPRTRPGRMRWRQELILDRIDPTRGLPKVPSPLPPPRLELGAGNDTVAAPTDTVAAPTDTIAAPTDTIAAAGGESPPASESPPHEIGRRRIARPGVAPSTSSPSRTTNTPFTMTWGMPAEG